MSKKSTGGVKPSEFKRKANNAPLINKIPTQSSSDNIPDAEKLRLIDQTGLMKKVKQREAELLVTKQGTTGEYIWQAIFLSIPFGFLMATFDVTVKVQFSEPWNYAGIVTKCAQSAPGKQYTINKEQSFADYFLDSTCPFYLFNKSLQIKTFNTSFDGHWIRYCRLIPHVYLTPFPFYGTNDACSWTSNCMDLFHCTTRPSSSNDNTNIGSFILVLWTKSLIFREEGVDTYFIT